MRENPDIDELLNGFIDGELTARQQTEVQRLISHDAQIAGRLRELQKCKILVGSLPCAEAPAEMTEQIKASFEGATLLTQQAQRLDEREGARHLLARKVLAAAAMIGLVAVLAAVVYTIVAPERVTDKPVAVEDWRQPTGKIEPAKPAMTIVATAEKSIAETTVAATGFKGSLELKTSNSSEMVAFINKVIEDNIPSDEWTAAIRGDVREPHALSCSRQALSLLLADLANIWTEFDSAKLFVEANQVGGQIMIDKVDPEQIVEIVNQDDFEMRIKAAKYFAALNNMTELLPGEEVLTAVDDKQPDLIAIPKPVLTSSKKTIKKPASQAKDDQKVQLTIVVVGR